MKLAAIVPEFVEYVPEKLEPGKLYVSMKYATAAHLCACGCGREVTTPLSPTDWRLQFDGEAVTLEPSIGNWVFDCRSHYWIRANRIRWSGALSAQQISAIRQRDKALKDAYYKRRPDAT
jgi:Family of unknown function (DUF6527)